MDHTKTLLCVLQYGVLYVQCVFHTVHTCFENSFIILIDEVCGQILGGTQHSSTNLPFKLPTWGVRRAKFRISSGWMSLKILNLYRM